LPVPVPVPVPVPEPEPEPEPEPLPPTPVEVTGSDVVVVVGEVVVVVVGEVVVVVVGVVVVVDVVVVVVVAGLRPVSVAVGAVPPLGGPVAITKVGVGDVAETSGVDPLTWVTPPLAAPFPEPAPAVPTLPAPPVVVDFGALCPFGTLEGTDDWALMTGRPARPGPPVKPVRPATTRTTAATPANAATARLLAKTSFEGFVAIAAAAAAAAPAPGSGSGWPKVREVKTSSSVA
jgi:hypothetical protein